MSDSQSRSSKLQRPSTGRHSRGSQDDAGSIVGVGAQGSSSDTNPIQLSGSPSSAGSHCVSSPTNPSCGLLFVVQEDEGLQHVHSLRDENAGLRLALEGVRKLQEESDSQQSGVPATGSSPVQVAPSLADGNSVVSFISGASLMPSTDVSSVAKALLIVSDWVQKCCVLVAAAFPNADLGQQVWEAEWTRACSEHLRCASMGKRRVTFAYRLCGCAGPQRALTVCLYSLVVSSVSA